MLNYKPANESIELQVQELKGELAKLKNIQMTNEVKKQVKDLEKQIIKLVDINMADYLKLDTKQNVMENFKRDYLSTQIQYKNKNLDFLNININYNNLYNNFKLYDFDTILLNIINKTNEKQSLLDLLNKRIKPKNFLAFKKSLFDITSLNYERFLSLGAIAVTDVSGLTESDLLTHNFIKTLKEPLYYVDD